MKELMDIEGKNEKAAKPNGRSLRLLLQAWQTAVLGKPLPQPPAYDGPDVWIKRFEENSRQATAGCCFVARVRATSDGHPYVQSAIESGATLIVAQRAAAELGVELPEGATYWQVPDTAEVLAWLSAAWHGFPANELVMIGVTGSDGKTSTSTILYKMLRVANVKAGLLTTIEAIIEGEAEGTGLHVTTPEAPAVQAYLRRMVNAGLTHCILEATSHGLEQQRVGAIPFDVAVVTNITHEHLDYHGSYENYFAAKAKLFETVGLSHADWGIAHQRKLAVRKTAVLNYDDGSFARLSKLPVEQTSVYGLGERTDVQASGLQFDADKTRFLLHLPSEDAPLPLETSLVGEFNVYNMLASAAVGEALGLTGRQMVEGLTAVSAISGRMERIDMGQDFLVVVDFAHSPNALIRAMGAARRMVGGGRIITVFGSAGKRDVAKRRLMAEASARDAELTVLTAEDPRTESLDEILALMVSGCEAEGGVEGETFWRVLDRGRAIHFALSLAQPDDMVLICGKGHEQSMCFGITEYPWDDREATRNLLAAFLAGKPTPDLGLPTF